MLKSFRDKILNILLICFLLAGPSLGCTCFLFDSNDGPIFGSNLDLFIPGNGLVFVNRRGISKQSLPSQAGTGGNTVRWESKFGSVSFNLAGREMAFGGMNEAGLVIGSMELLKSEFPARDERPGLNIGMWAQYVLDTCKDIEDVKKVHLKARIEDSAPPVHFLIADANGSCVAIEWIDGEYKCYWGDDLPVKAMSNMQYGKALASLKRGGPKFWWSNPGQSAQRFAAAYGRSLQYDLNVDQNAISYVFETLTKVVAAPHTKWSIVYDIANREIWYGSYKSRALKHISFENLDFSCESPLLMLDVNTQIQGDVEKHFKPYDHDTNMRLLKNICESYKLDLSQKDADVFIAYIESFECSEYADLPVYANYIFENGKPLLGNKNYQAISYSGYRTEKRNAENCPTIGEIKEDMKILSAMQIKLLRTYNTQQFPQATRILRAIDEIKKDDPKFEMYVMLGSWIQCEGAYGESPNHYIGDFEFNSSEIAAAIELANKYPDIVKIIAVGNEAMVHWQAHHVHPSVILRWVNHLKKARSNGKIPQKTLITTSDNWAALGGTQEYRNDILLKILKRIDFVSLHTYAFHDTYYDADFKWADQGNREMPITKQAESAIEKAIEHQKEQYDAVKKYLKENGIDKQIHIGETGWASMDDSHYGNKGTCAADEYKASLFYKAVKKWTNENNITCFYFQAFDEPWKSESVNGSESHFGLFTADGKAKYMLWDIVNNETFHGLKRGNNNIKKTFNGDKGLLLKTVKAPKHIKFKP